MPLKNIGIGVQDKLRQNQAREVIASALDCIKREAENRIKIPLANYKGKLLPAPKLGESSYRSIVRRSSKKNKLRNGNFCHLQ